MTAGKLGEDAAGLGEADVGALADGKVAESLGDVGFADADRTSNAQDLWIGSRRARGRRTFPNDPLMVTE